MCTPEEQRSHMSPKVQFYVWKKALSSRRGAITEMCNSNVIEQKLLTTSRPTALQVTADITNGGFVAFC